MIKTATTYLVGLIIASTVFAAPTEARHHTKAKSPTKTSSDNSPASYFCGKWTGTLSGNDPHVNAVLVLTNQGDHYNGNLLWVSEKSGACKRAVSGYYDPATHTCLLKDDHITSSKPTQAWHFCPIKKYALQLGSDSVTLSGTYDSPECKDFGSVDLSKPKNLPR